MSGRPWTAEESEIVRREYRRLGVDAVASMLGRSRHSVYHQARKLGALKWPKWTRAEEEKIRYFWGFLSVDELAKRINRSPAAVYERSKVLGLKRGCPQGYEYVKHAAQRAGYDAQTFRKILAWAGVRLHRTMSRPDTRGPRECMCVDPFEVDEALERWFAREQCA